MSLRRFCDICNKEMIFLNDGMTVEFSYRVYKDPQKYFIKFDHVCSDCWPIFEERFKRMIKELGEEINASTQKRD